MMKSPLRNAALVVRLTCALAGLAGGARAAAPTAPAAPTDPTLEMAQAATPAIITPARDSGDLLLMEPAPSDTFLNQYSATGRFNLGRPGAFRITPDGRSVLFLRSGGRDFNQNLYEFSTVTGKEKLLLSAEQLLGGLPEFMSAGEQARRERQRTLGKGIAGFQLSEDGRRIVTTLSGRIILFDRRTGESRQIRSGSGPAEDPRFSADGQLVACVRNNNLYYADVESRQEHPLSAVNHPAIAYGTAEFVAQEEMQRPEGYWWAPDRALLLAQVTDNSTVEELNIFDPSHPERTPQTWRYPRAGRSNARVSLQLIPAQTGTAVTVEWDHDKYPYLARVRWTTNAPLTLLVQNRAQTEELLLTVDLLNGGTTVLHRETDATWINLDAGMPCWRADGQSFLWMTERNGGPQLELRGRDGALIRAVTPVELNYRSLIGLDDRAGVAWVVAGPNPTEAHIYRVPLDPAQGPPVAWTTEPGQHGGVLSKDGSLLVHTAELLDGTRRVTVERTALAAPRRVIGEIASRAETPPFMPQPELIPPFPGTNCWSVLLRPRNFRPGARYPVLLSVYGGPHSQMVRATARAYMMEQWLANQGYLVVAIDGRGTPARGRDWERAIHHNLIDAPLTDQVETLKLLAARYPELDVHRCGVYGWSFGGYFAAMAVMRHPEIFRAGIAAAPVVDWRDYDTHYTERYLGLPDKEGAAIYDSSSVLSYAGRLERPLLIVHGTADDNVYLLNSLKLTEALFRAGKTFEFLPLVGFTHRVNEPQAARRLYARYLEFFQRNLAPEE